MTDTATDRQLRQAAEGAEVGRTLETLYEHRDQLNRDMRAIRKDLARIRTRHEAADLRELQTMKLERIEGLQEQINAAEFALAAKEEADPSGEDGLESTTGPTPHQLEILDPKLADLRQMRDDAETEFRLVQDRYLPGTVPYQQAQRRLETTRTLYDEQHARALELWRRYGAAALPDQRGGGDLESYYHALSAPRLRQEITDLMTEAGAIREDLQQIILDIQELDDKEYEKSRIQTDLDHTTSRIQQLELNEASIVKRISIAQEGFRPRTPYDDSRAKRAVMGLAFGCMLSFGGFFLLGTIDRRTYGTHQLRQSLGEDIAGCLGVLPDLGQSIDNPESSDIAAHCVHQIRNQIEAIRDPRRGFVLAVSSPFQGDGKTSIVMALGWSYAAAGYNTLLIDCDLVGRSLSRQLGRLGEEGLKEALRDRQINGWISPVPVSNLSILPAGLDSRIGPHSLRRIDLDDLLTKVRATFDVIIVDTGPMLGSLESTPVAASADGVVLSVRRGRSRTRLEECKAKLRTIGAHCIGVILNYAVRSDCHRYVSEASLAAAEGNHDGDRKSVVRTAQDERNVLMLAMEHTTQSQCAEEEPRRAAS